MARSRRPAGQSRAGGATVRHCRLRGSKCVLYSTNLPLGLAPAGDFGKGPALTLERGDLVFLLSDGIVEAPSGAGAPFSIGRALELVREHRHQPPDEIVATLLHKVREWSHSAEVDDMTAVVIKVGDQPGAGQHVC